MTDDGHMVFVSAEQAEVIEEVGIELSRNRDDRAIKLLSLALAYRWARPFACNIDESAGLAEDNVTDIRSRIDEYSKRA